MSNNRESYSSQPVVSIIVSTLNCGESIVRTLHSVDQAMGSEHVEVIIIDGGSTDGTVNLLEENALLVDVFVSEQDEGIYDAWNKGIKLAKGEWVIFLGAGDLLGKSWVDCLVGIQSDAQVVYGDQILELNGISFVRESLPWNQIKVSLPFEMSLPHVGLAHHKSLFDARGFDASYKIIGDWEFLSCGLVERGEYVPGAIQAKMEMGEGISNSPSHVNAQYNELQRCFANRGGSFTMKMRTLWFLKRALQYVPFMFRWAQKFYWKVKLRVGRHLEKGEG